jgi:hypothetical protein
VPEVDTSGGVKATFGIPDDADGATDNDRSSAPAKERKIFLNIWLTHPQ